MIVFDPHARVKHPQPNISRLFGLIHICYVAFYLAVLYWPEAGTCGRGTFTKLAARPNEAARRLKRKHCLPAPSGAGKSGLVARDDTAGLTGRRLLALAQLDEVHERLLH